MQLSSALQSSALTGAEYDTDSKELKIVFASRRTYTYHDVPQKIYDELITAPSAGQYWHSAIKDAFT